jgi:GntR family transcriptional repressor for pyruvate dehydrogenase complex
MKEEEYEFTSIKRQRMSDQVAAALEDYIIKKNLRANDKLPSEKKLCELFHVGSRTIREALKALEAKSILHIVQGKGTILIDPTYDTYLKGLANSIRYASSSEKGKLIELMFVRKIIEVGAVKQIIIAGVPKDLFTKLAENIESQKAASVLSDTSAYAKLDAEYHQTLIECTGNSILISFYSNMYYLLRIGMHETGALPGSLNEGLNEHIQLFQAIVNKDIMLAIKILEQHIDSSTKKLRQVLSQKE